MISIKVAKRERHGVGVQAQARRLQRRATMNAIVRARNVARCLAGPVRDRGLREAIHSIHLVRTAQKRELSEAFDARFGTNTSRRFRRSDLDATGGDVPSLWRYYPITRAGFDPAMKA